jgi:hypothetical protein
MRPAKWRKKNPDVTSQIKCAGLAYFYINRLPTSRNVSQPSCVCVCTYSTLEFSTEQGCQIFLGAKIPKWGGDTWPDFSWRKNTKTEVNIQNDHKVYQNFPLQGLSWSIKIGIFGIKCLFHQATLVERLSTKRLTKAAPLTPSENTLILQRDQGDQIGRKFAQCMIVYVLDSLLKITEVGHIVGLLFSTVKAMH